ncbi:MAG TPA: hypothetical protein PKM72_08945 [Nitrospirales bacterium]|nr:hypothetical protein [Nitrospirales bacterium]
MLAGVIGLGFADMVELSFIRQWVVLMLFIQLGVVAHFSSQQNFIEGRHAQIDPYSSNPY